MDPSTEPLDHLSPTSPVERGAGVEDTLVTDSDEEQPGWPKLPFLHLPREKHKIPRKVKEQKMLVKAQQDILKFNRMGTHLANERTLLAWVGSVTS